MDSTVRDRILDEWLAQVLQSYPEQTARALAADAEPFRNAAGRTLRDSLSTLVDAVLLGDGHPGVGDALDALVRLRAVQDFTAAQAVGFLLALKPILRQDPDTTAAKQVYDDRIDRLMLLAFDHYVQCREQLAEIKVNEAKRQMWLLDHLTPR